MQSTPLNSEFITLHAMKRPTPDWNERLRQALQESDLAHGSELAARVGLSKATISQWMSGGIEPRYSSIVPVAHTLGVSPDWLLYGEGGKHATGWSGVREPGATRMIPVISWVQAGRPKEAVDIYAEGDGFDEVPVSGTMAYKLGRYAFALEIEGDSMEPEFREGESIIVDPDACVRPGDYVVARVDSGEVTFKKYRDRGHDRDGAPVYELVPLNDNYATISVDADNPAEIVGKVISHQRQF
ncbi:SOS-response transcriptional repressor LexA (RecA-mediated autopeptidase) [Thiohalospira halophila DSM 15071]|uniref:SOS-response transcriptional repressor LexA (RecA-mediated autopeptidase) n=1 Tax=Thiohalospira halophila DSM 15071 TaxID=1123397 RepID=A0A1I1U9Q1_9GAMM|nr:XRE family transcriptional regulator [Thiohalospira halophila]SFD67365.1 SOS-response transcriptional repressor LexA (RecA-mediated autopeptidase) [Thiohalospira halophila DSM 15071]